MPAGVVLRSLRLGPFGHEKVTGKEGFMRTEIVQLPSGASVTLRKISMKEENHLTGAIRSKRRKQNKVLVDVVDACCLGFEETGPYTWARKGNKVDWQKMLNGDFIAAMIGLRKLSYREGVNYTVDVKCTNRACNNRFQHTVNLDKDLFYQQLPQESFDKLMEDEPFTVEIQGKKVHFKLNYVADETFQEKLEKKFPGRGMSTLFRSRISKIEGVKPRDWMNWLDGETEGKKKGPYEGLDSDDAEDLRLAFFKVDCGVDTEVEAECPRGSCGEVFTFELPFAGMLSPGRASDEKRRRRLKAQEEPDEDIDLETQEEESETPEADSDSSSED